jgi:glycosyltransferase involved in cell wall biosynthesis
MAKLSFPRLLMLGPVADGRDAVATVVNAYRAHRLFERWPIDYVATYSDAGLLENARLLARALGRFVATVCRERSVVVHLHSAPQRGAWRELAFVLLALAARCPLILHLHGTAFRRVHDGGGRPARLLIRSVLEHAACVVVPCEAMLTWARAVTRRVNIACVPDPVTATECPHEARQANLIVFLGALEPEHGIFELLEAVSALRPAVPDVRLLCAGEGRREAVLAYAERLGIGDAVKVTGWVGPSGKRAVLEAAAVLAMPSYEESLPVGLLEAMAAGVPVVAAPVGGVPEVVADGVNGLLAAPGDVATLQRQLRKVLLDRKLGARLGAAARESVRPRHAPERALGRLAGVYAALGLHAFGDAAPPLQEARAPRAAL